MANGVRNLLGPPLRLRGPVTRADGGKSGVGRGYGGAKIDLAGPAGSTTSRSWPQR